MNEPTYPTLKICPQCAAECFAASKQCWLCRADLSGVEEVVVAEAVRGGSPLDVSEAVFIVMFYNIE